MTGRTVLVTGGSGGIGKATARGLAAQGAGVAITGRDRGRAGAAAEEIRADGGPPVGVFVADMSAQADVRRLASEVLQVLPRLDVLVNNVGGFWNTRHVTTDGLEHTFALNHLAPFLHPGIVRTGFGAEDSGRIQRVIMPFAPLVMKSPEKGALTSIHLASAPEVEGVTGQFFANRKPRPSSKRSHDEADASRLWEVSGELVGLDATTAGPLATCRRDAS
jgi:hypothetical protein